MTEKEKNNSKSKTGITHDESSAKPEKNRDYVKHSQENNENQFDVAAESISGSLSQLPHLKRLKRMRGNRKMILASSKKSREARTCMKVERSN